MFNFPQDNNEITIFLSDYPHLFVWNQIPYKRNLLNFFIIFLATFVLVS